MKVRWSGPEPGLFRLHIQPGAPGDPESAPGGGTIAPPAPNPTPPPPRPPSESDGSEQWDEARARSLITRLRPFETQAKQLETELAQVKDELKKRTDAELSESERLTARVKELETAATAAHDRLVEQLLRNAVIVEARKLEYKDDEDALAYVVLHHAEVERDAEGNPTNIHALLKSAIEHKPHLKATAAPSHVSIPGTPRAQQPPAKAALEQSMEAQLRARGNYAPMG